MPFKRKRLSTRDRERLFNKARGDEECPTCPRCELLVRKTDRWHAGHELSPLLGGRNDADQVEHAFCNLRFAREYEVPLIAHNDRMRQRANGAYRSRYPMRGGRDDTIKRTMGGRVVERRPRFHAVTPEV